jgi:Zn-dependent peptidase ImmA (M78 family)/DNA-binding XRE family transcriptional regulator
MPVFNPQRLTVARLRRGMSKRDLAKEAGVVERTIAGLEASEHPASDETVDALVRALRFPRPFFFAGDISPIAADGASFRALTKMRAPDRDAVLASGSIAFEIATYVETRFRLPHPNVPDFRNAEPAAAAVALRREWAIGERPIRNAVHLLELHGVRVFSLPPECAKEVDAFSIWHGDRPFVFLNTGKSGERGRFDAAHELAHLVLHRHGAPQGRVAENEADAFASAFLMPEGAVRAAAPRFVTLDGLVALKSRWGVSVAALVRRFSDLALINRWQYRNLYMQLSQRGWRLKEPQGLPHETSQVWQKILMKLREDGVPLGSFASDLHLPMKELESLVFQLVLASIDGGRSGGGPRPPSPSAGTRPLRLVRG